MSRKKLGVRFLRACCGKTTFFRHHTWTVGHVMEATIDCRYCGALCIIPMEQFDGMPEDQVPMEIKMELFHKIMNQRNPEWPVDGFGTGYVEF